ncbi:hypothetical protein F5878DRAFT_647445 [Lentinula raphanica]|uniref:Uncharacterized protein n=1 Tax=Lentinula raphanica TaxID=153919 RepID=A0AA38UA62_9AGAR|nr:hypothetical protein F5878DRAFT_647445 [Lentinula raphanica]
MINDQDDTENTEGSVNVNKVIQVDIKTEVFSLILSTIRRYTSWYYSIGAQFNTGSAGEQNPGYQYSQEPKSTSLFYFSLGHKLCSSSLDEKILTWSEKDAANGYGFWFGFELGVEVEVKGKVDIGVKVGVKVDVKVGVKVDVKVGVKVGVEVGIDIGVDVKARVGVEVGVTAVVTIVLDYKNRCISSM